MSRDVTQKKGNMYTKKGRVLIYGNVLVLVYIAHSF